MKFFIYFKQLDFIIAFDFFLYESICMNLKQTTTKHRITPRQLGAYTKLDVRIEVIIVLQT